tara:strand:+ start:155 stop:499 length:345 start_codon:yes stop_codon:yes gene_type:complete
MNNIASIRADLDTLIGGVPTENDRLKQLLPNVAPSFFRALPGRPVIWVLSRVLNGSQANLNLVAPDRAETWVQVATNLGTTMAAMNVPDTSEALADSGTSTLPDPAGYVRASPP